MGACVARQPDERRENCAACRAGAGRLRLVEANQTEEREKSGDFGIRRQAGGQSESSTRRSTSKGGTLTIRSEAFSDKQSDTDDREMAATIGWHSMGLCKYAVTAT